MLPPSLLASFYAFPTRVVSSALRLPHQRSFLRLLLQLGHHLGARQDLRLLPDRPDPSQPDHGNQ
mgnify:CR=1 FL=1